MDLLAREELLLPHQVEETGSMVQHSLHFLVPPAEIA
jgi:hypothetical protein